MGISGLQEVFQNLVCEEAYYFEYILSLTAIVFAIIGDGGHGCDNPSSFYLIHCLVEAFSKGFLTEVMSFLTWKLIFWNRPEEITRKKQIMYLLVFTGVRVLWVYLTNICFSSMATNMEAAIALLEFLLLIAMIRVIVKLACTAFSDIYSTIECEVPVTDSQITVQTLDSQTYITKDSREEMRPQVVGPEAGDSFYMHTCGKPLSAKVVDSEIEHPPNHRTTEVNHRVINLSSAVRVIESRTRSGAVYSRKRLESSASL